MLTVVDQIVNTPLEREHVSCEPSLEDIADAVLRGELFAGLVTRMRNMP